MAEQAVLAQFLAEVFAPNADSSRLSKECARISAATKTFRRAGIDVRCVDSFLAPAEETAFHLFEAPNAKAIGELLHAAEIDAERVSVVVGRRDAAKTIASCASDQGDVRSAGTRSRLDGRLEGDEEDA